MGGHRTLTSTADAMGVEGSQGTDIVRRPIVPMNGYAGLVSVEARSLVPVRSARWMDEEMFAFNGTGSIVSHHVRGC